MYGSELTYFAVAAFAILGILEARRHEKDVFGATIVPFVTAFGGGTLRKELQSAA